jgi:hypothetical protein
MIIDSWPLSIHHLKIRFYSITTCLLCRIYIRQNPKEKAPKNDFKSMQIIGYKSRESQDSVTVDYQVGLPVGPHSVFSRFPHAHLSTSCQLTSSNLPRRATSTIDFVFTRSNHLELRLVVDSFEGQSIHLD